MATNPTKSLEAEIERLVRKHLMAQRVAVAAAVERAFAVAVDGRRRAKQPARPTSTHQRRSPGEMAGDVNRLFEAVRAHPGETMTFLAAELGQTRAALVRPMMLLKASGRVRSAGARNHTHYFPMNGSKAA